MNDIWKQKHAEYASKEWAGQPSIFAEQIAQYLPAHPLILELGAGLGNDAKYFSELGATVVATDTELEATRAVEGKNVKVEYCDMIVPLAYGDGTFDVVYAHLALHYFDDVTTRTLFRDIYRILKPGGVLAFLVNSTSDPEYNQGIKIEENYYYIDGKNKRYFTADTAKRYAKDFVPIVCDNAGETYKDAAKGVHNLIRFIGTK